MNIFTKIEYIRCTKSVKRLTINFLSWARYSQLSCYQSVDGGHFKNTQTQSWTEPELFRVRQVPGFFYMSAPPRWKNPRNELRIRYQLRLVMNLLLTEQAVNRCKMWDAWPVVSHVGRAWPDQVSSLVTNLCSFVRWWETINGSTKRAPRRMWITSAGEDKSSSVPCKRSRATNHRVGPRRKFGSQNI
jgi:hypothetical protein